MMSRQACLFPPAVLSTRPFKGPTPPPGPLPSQMFNLLIGLISNTFSEVSADAERHWLLQRARITLLMERRFLGVEYVAHR